MKTKSKRYREVSQQVDKTKQFTLEEAMAMVKQTTNAKFDESVDLAFKLGVDPRHPEQMVRGTVSLPYGTGKKVRVAVFAKGEKIKEALDAGADYAGAADLIEKVSKGFFDFDATIATPDIMGDVSKLGKLLGPKKLMPSPKSGTVTFDVTQAVKELKMGKVEYRVDKNANIHLSVGKASFSEDQLLENCKAVIEAIVHSKPSAAKGQYLRKAALSSTMGPGIKLDCIQLSQRFKR